MLLTIGLITAVALFVIWQVNRHMESRFWKLGLSSSIMLIAMSASGILLSTSTEDVLAQQQAALDILDEAQVRSGDLIITVNATGPITPLREVTLDFETSAVVTEVLVEEGAVVRQGDVIARLDSESTEEDLEDAQFAYDRQLVSFQDLIGPPREVDVVAAENAVRAAQLSQGGSAVLTGPGSNQAEIDRLNAELARNQLWQSQLQRDQAMEGVTAASVNLASAQNSQFVGPEGEDQAQEALDDSLYNAIVAESGVVSAEGSVEVADAEYAAELGRNPEYGGGSGAAASLAEAEVELDNVLNGPNSIDVIRARTDLALAENTLLQVEDRLGDTVLVAPFDGVIVENNLTVGEVPQPNSIVLSDPSLLYVDLQIDEVDIASVQVGQTVVMDVDALPGEEIAGMVDRVFLTPELVDQVVTYRTRILLEPTDAAIRMGMSTTAQVAVQNVSDVTLVPNRFISFDEELQVTFVTVQAEDGGYLNIPVEIGTRSDTASEVLSGVEPGQTVVLLPRETRSQVAFSN